MQPEKQTSDRIKNIDIIEKPRFEKLEVVMTYKNTTSQYHLFETIASSLFALSENVEDELHRELKENVTETNNNQSRFTMNKLLNEEQDEVNKQLTSFNVVGITSPLQSTSEDEDESRSITSDPQSLSSDDDYFKINETTGSLLSFIKRNITVISNVLSKGKVKVDEQSCRGERLIALYKLGRQKFKDIAAQTQHDIFDYLEKNLYRKSYSEVWKLFTFKKKAYDFFNLTLYHVINLYTILFSI